MRRGLGRAEKQRYAELLARFAMGLEDRLEAQAGTLSGGQRQAVTLLMATISRPAICCSTSTRLRSTPKPQNRSDR